MKKWLSLLCAMCLLVSCTIGSSALAVTADEFDDPDQSVRTKVRYWWPGAYVINDLDAMVADIEAIADAGFGGFELADVWDNMSDEDSLELDPELYGYGSDNWKTALKLALETAKENDLTVDLTISAHWPATVTTITPNDEGAAVELVCGTYVLESGESYEGALPDPMNYQSETFTSGEEIENRLLSLQVMVLSDDQTLAVSETGYSSFSIWDTETAFVVDYDATEDITDLADADALTMSEYTAPDDGKTRIIVAMYERGTGQRCNMMMNVTDEDQRSDVTETHAYGVDHFSLTGTQLIIDYWEELLLDDELRELLSEVGGAIFEDSLELWTIGYWSSDMIETFQEQMGYDITPYLPYLVGVNKNDAEQASTSLIQVESDTDEASIVSRVRRDYMEVLNYMFIEYHLKPLQEWAEESLGMEYRVQAYGVVVDSGEAAAEVSIIEGEQVEVSFRLLAAGRDLAGSTILSDESGRISEAYSITLKEELIDLNQHYAAGVNQAVLHGYAYDYAPGATWPGFAAFTSAGDTTGISEAWGDRSPMWEDMESVNDYVGRVQTILQAGINQVDIAIYTTYTYANMQAHPLSDDVIGWVDESLGDAGYTYQYLTDGLLDLAAVEDGVLAADGPAYKAIVIDNADVMTIEAAETLLGYAQAGLPVYVIGDLPTITRNNSAEDADADSETLYAAYEEENAELAALMEELSAEATVVFVATQEELSGVLAESTITPDADFADATTLETVHRMDGDTDYYYIFNNSEEAAATEITFVGEGVPYAMDAWSGEVTPIAEYEVTEDGIVLEVSLAAYDTTIIAFAPENSFECETSDVYVVSTTADEAIYLDGQITLLDAEGGAVEATLSDGTTVEATLDAASEALNLNGQAWSLSLESWTPGDVENDVADTLKTTYEIELDALTPWTSIEGYESVSGIGTYSTTVTLDAAQAASYAVLTVGDSNDTIQVTVNGVSAVANQSTGVVDLTGMLVEGENTLVIQVASNLRNVMNAVYSTEEEPSESEDQSYGINGEVTIDFYSMFVIE